MSGKVDSTDDQNLHIKSAEPGLAALGAKTKTRLAHPPCPPRDRPQHLPGPPGAESAGPPKSRPPGERETFALRDNSPTTAEAVKLFSESPRARQISIMQQAMFHLVQNIQTQYFPSRMLL